MFSIEREKKKITDELKQIKKEVIDCISENILDQVLNHGLRRFLSCMIAMGLIMYTHLMKNGSDSLVCICYIK